MEDQYQQLRELLERTFPSGVPPDPKVGIKAHVKVALDFMASMGFKVVEVNEAKNTVKFQVFIGNPQDRKGATINFICPPEAITKSTLEEFVMHVIANVGAAFSNLTRDQLQHRKK